MAGIVVGNSCLEKDVREVLAAVAPKNPAFVMEFLNNLIPDCVAVPAAKEKAASTRKMPSPWLAPGGKLIYMDKDCKEQEFTSPSAVMNALGIKTSGIQCLEDGTKCHVESQIDTLRRHGYTARSDKGDDITKGSMLITIIHPDCVAAMAVEKTASKRLKAGEVVTRKATAAELAGLNK